MPTIFTRIVNGEIPCVKLWEDDDFLAFMDIKPIQPGMTLLIPKKEIENLFEMDDDMYSRMMLRAKRLVPAIQKAMNSERVAMVIEQLEVLHAHLKLIPINGPGDLDHHHAKDATTEGLQEIAEKIKAHLS